MIFTPSPTSTWKCGGLCAWVLRASSQLRSMLGAEGREILGCGALAVPGEDLELAHRRFRTRPGARQGPKGSRPRPRCVGAEAPSPPSRSKHCALGLRGPCVRCLSTNDTGQRRAEPGWKPPPFPCPVTRKAFLGRLCVQFPHISSPGVLCDCRFGKGCKGGPFRDQRENEAFQGRRRTEVRRGALGP